MLHFCRGTIPGKVFLNLFNCAIIFLVLEEHELQIQPSKRLRFKKLLAFTLKSNLSYVIVSSVKGWFQRCTLSGLQQFLATKSPLKMMENAFYFSLKALFVLERFKILF